MRPASAGLGHPGSQRPGHLGQMQEPGQPAAAQMVERVDKAARRRQLLTELAALENG